MEPTAATGRQSWPGPSTAGPVCCGRCGGQERGPDSPLRARGGRRWHACCTGLLAEAREPPIAPGESDSLQRIEHERFARFKASRVPCSATGWNQGRAPKTALVVSSRCPTVEGGSAPSAALQMAASGRSSCSKTNKAPAPHYELAGSTRSTCGRIPHVTRLFTPPPTSSGDANSQDLSRMTHAASGTHRRLHGLRRLRLGVLDLRTPGSRSARPLRGLSMSSVMEAQHSAGRASGSGPHGPGYAKGELFETCSNGLDVVAMTPHRSNALMLNYGRQNRDHHLTSLRPIPGQLFEIWNGRRQTTRSQRSRIELRGFNDWFGALRRGPRRAQGKRVAQLSGPDPAVEDGVHFSHAGCAVDVGNDPVSPTKNGFSKPCRRRAQRPCQLIIKIHPANTWKQAGKYRGDPAVRVLRERFGTLFGTHHRHPAGHDREHVLVVGARRLWRDRSRDGRRQAGARHPGVHRRGGAICRAGFTVDSESRGEYLAS